MNLIAIIIATTIITSLIFYWVAVLNVNRIYRNLAITEVDLSLSSTVLKDDYGNISLKPYEITISPDGECLVTLNQMTYHADGISDEIWNSILDKLDEINGVQWVYRYKLSFTQALLDESLEYVIYLKWAV